MEAFRSLFQHQIDEIMSMYAQHDYEIDYFFCMHYMILHISFVVVDFNVLYTLCFSDYDSQTHNNTNSVQ